MPVMVRFNDQAVFLDELAKFHLGPRVVRVCVRRETVADVVFFVDFALVAGFLDDEQRLFELVARLGSQTASHEDSEFFRSIEERRLALIDAVRALGHEVRSGRFLLEQRP